MAVGRQPGPRRRPPPIRTRFTMPRRPPFLTQPGNLIESAPAYRYLRCMRGMRILSARDWRLSPTPRATSSVCVTVTRSAR
jgi:hypothetical protein